MTERISLPTPDGDMPVDLTHPAGDARGAIVVVQEAFGVNDHIRSLCDRLAADGWYAVAPHLFHRQGSPELGYEDLSKVMPVMGAQTEPGIRADIDATLAHLAGEGFTLDRTGMIGFCMGGTVALWAAVEFEFGAVVTFYGGGITEGRFGFESGLESGPKLRSPWLGLYGDLDKGIPVEQVEALREATTAAAVPTEIVRYPEGEHGFNCDVRASYHAESAAAAWTRMSDWLASNIR